MPFMTIPEAAILWHISVSELRELCENHMISGAVRASALVYPGNGGLSLGAASTFLNPDAPPEQEVFPWHKPICTSTAA